MCAIRSGKMLSRLAQLSHERQLVVIGEDLGHVPEGFREVMAEAAILSYRIPLFRTVGGRVPGKRPITRGARLPVLATHDLPTFRGWWQGHDAELRLDYGLIDTTGGADEQRDNRQKEREALAGLLPGGQADACGMARRRSTGPTNHRRTA